MSSGGDGRTERILLAHGDGGLLTARLVEEVFLKRLGGQPAGGLLDAAILGDPGGVDGSGGAGGPGGRTGRAGPGFGGSRLALTTDSFVVKPIFFPGGDIGSLAIHGTVNDLTSVGARPLALSAAFILEEGLEVSVLERVVDSMGAAAARVGVAIVTGDTKVVERGAADGLFINTAGLGEVLPAADLSFARLRPGDRVLISGTVGDHGVAVLSKRKGLSFETAVVSDSAPLFDLVAPVLEQVPGVKFLRDPTRGGLATTLKEIAASSGLDIVIDEDRIPVRPAVAGACELLGLDPLYLANEGKMIVVVEEGGAAGALRILRDHPLGVEAAEIGRVEAGRGDLWLTTSLGGTKHLDRLAGEQLPRIC